MQYKKVLSRGGALVACISVYGAIAISNGPDWSKYIVTDKKDSLLVFKTLDSRHSEWVMDFALDSATHDLMLDYYQYIQIGDTLCGSGMNRDIIMTPYNRNFMSSLPVPKITRINGKNAYHVINARSKMSPEQQKQR